MRSEAGMSRYLHFAMQACAARPHWLLLPVRVRQACSVSVHFCRQVAWADTSEAVTKDAATTARTTDNPTMAARMVSPISVGGSKAFNAGRRRASPNLE